MAKGKFKGWPQPKSEVVLEGITEEHRLYYKSESRKEKGMDTEHVRHLLNQWGNEAIELAQKLRDSGDPLSDKQKLLLKMAKFSYMEEALREAMMFWFMDNHLDFIRSLEIVKRDFTD